MPALTVTIDGDPVCPYAPDGQIQISTTETLNGRATAALTIQDVNHALYAAKQPNGWLFKEIEILHGTEKVFAGIVTRQINANEPGMSQHGYIRLHCADWAWWLDVRRIFKSWEAGEYVNSIVGEVLAFEGPAGDSLADLGFTAANTSNTITIPSRYIADGKTAWEVISEIAGIVGYHAFVDWDKDIHFQQAGDTAPFNIDEAVGVTNFESATTEGTTENYRNTQWIRQDLAALSPLIQVFEGDGSETGFFVDFPLAEAPRVFVRTATYAQATVTFTGNPADSDTITIDGQAYTFKNTPSAARHVQRGANALESIRNLVYAVNGNASWSGVYFHADTALHPTCDLAWQGALVAQIRFRDIGNGNGTAVSESSSAISLSGSTLTGAAAGDNDEKTVGIFGVDPAGSADWFWAPGSTAIKQDGGGTALAVAEFLEVQYRKLFSNSVYASDEAEVTARGRVESLEDAETSSTGADMYRTAQARLRKYATPDAILINYVANSYKASLLSQLRVGMEQTADLSGTHGFSGELLVTDITRSFVIAKRTVHSRANIAGIAYPVGSDREPWERWMDLFLPRTGSGSSSGSAGGGVVAGGGSVSVPGPIRNLAIGTIDYDADPGFALIPVTWDPPLTPNNFDRIQFWITASGVDPVDVGILTHPVGSASAGSGTLRVARPTAADWTSAILWGASGSTTYQNSLVTASGDGQTPNVSAGTILSAPGSVAGTPTAPTAVSLTIPLDGDTFSLSTSWTPDSPVGGTTKWGREVRYFSDAACTTPDSDWIELGDVYGDTVTAAVSGPFPRPPADQWVKLRVRGLNWQDEASAWTTLATGVKLDQSTGGYELPNAPSACSVSIVGREETFALQIGITPPSPLGGTAGYDREARYYNDAGLTSPDSDWIPLGWVDDAATTSVTAFWPRPQANQWVLVRVRANNWNGDVTSWVQSASAAALTPVATPPAIAANTTTVRSKSDNGIPKFGFRVVITEAGSPGSTDWYEVQARFWTDVGLTTPDSEWIPLGGTSRAQLTLDTDYWDRPKATQYAKTRVAGKNANGTLGAWVESSTQTITASSGINAGELDPTSIDGTNFAIVAGVLDLPASAISAFEIASAAVTNAKLAADSVDSSKIQNATIVGGDIAAATIAGSNIANGTILGANIGSATIVSANIQDATIAAIDIALATILGSNIASATITGANIQDASISGTDIASATITAVNIAAATITATEIAAATITGSQIADASIFADKIGSATITAANIAANTVTGAQIADSSITGADLASLTITAAKIANLTITAAQITDLTINGTKITDSAVSNAKVATSTLTGDKLANATITGSKIATATITGTLIQSATIAGSNIASGTITATQIATGTIVATNIANLTITASQIADLTITSGKIASITADKITAGTISATITMTSPVINSPNISVTGSNFSISINTTNAIRVQGTFTGITSTIAANGFAVSDASSYSGTLSPGGLGILGSQGQFSFSAGAFGSLVNNSAQGWTLRPTFFSNSASGAYIDLTGFNQYITASQFRYPAGAYGSESLALSLLTTTHVIYAYGPGGFYLGKIPVFY